MRPLCLVPDRRTPPMISANARPGILWRPAPLRCLLHTGRQSSRCPRTPPWTAIKRGRPLRVHPHIFFAGAGCRSIHIPPVLLPPVVFGGLLVGLWIWYVRSAGSSVATCR